MGFLETAVKGQGQVAFLAGDAGSGKSSLLAAFAEEASQAHEGLLVAWGAGNAFSGLVEISEEMVVVPDTAQSLGDPRRWGDLYLPPAPGRQMVRRPNGDGR